MLTTDCECVDVMLASNPVLRSLIDGAGHM